MLKSVTKPHEKTEVPYGSDSPIYQCEACPISKPSHLMINFMVAVGSPGHPSLQGWQCPGGDNNDSPEHWACSPECWQKVAHACIDEHMHQLLLYYHSTLQAVPSSVAG